MKSFITSGPGSQNKLDGPTVSTIITWIRTSKSDEFIGSHVVGLPKVLDKVGKISKSLSTVQEAKICQGNVTTKKYTHVCTVLPLNNKPYYNTDLDIRGCQWGLLIS